MATDLRYTPKPKNRRAYVLAAVPTLLGVLLFVLAPLLPAGVGVLQMVSLLFVVGGIYLATKYIFFTNTYVLMTTEKGESFFLVEQAQGRRKSTVCQLPFERIIALHPTAEKAEGKSVYAYLATPGTKECQLIVARDESGSAVYIKIEADEAFFSALQVRLKEISPPSLHHSDS